MSGSLTPVFPAGKNASSLQVSRPRHAAHSALPQPRACPCLPHPHRALLRHRGDHPMAGRLSGFRRRRFRPILIPDDRQALPCAGHADIHKRAKQSALGIVLSRLFSSLFPRVAPGRDILQKRLFPPLCQTARQNQRHVRKIHALHAVNGRYRDGIHRDVISPLGPRVFRRPYGHHAEPGRLPQKPLRKVSVGFGVQHGHIPL